MPQVLSSWWLDVELREGPVNAAVLPLKRSHGAEVVLKVISKVAASLDGVVPGHGSTFPLSSLNWQAIKTCQEPTCPNTIQHHHLTTCPIVGCFFHPRYLFGPHFLEGLAITKVPKLCEAREDPQHVHLVLLEAQGGAYLLGQELDVRQGWSPELQDHLH